MGRTPDHVACVLTAFSAWRHLFDAGGARFGDNVVRFHARARDEDLYVTYAIVPPQVDRSRPAHRHPEPFLHPGVVRETSAGIVVRGAHAIATSATMADWLFVSYITPLVPGDEDYAISLVMPMNAEGLRLYPRRPFASLATSVYDYPLSSRFDEVDTTVVFNDDFVPWDQVFIYRNVDLVNTQFHDSPSHTTANFQALVRFGVKLEFMAGLAARLAELQALDAVLGLRRHRVGRAADPVRDVLLGVAAGRESAHVQVVRLECRQTARRTLSQRVLTWRARCGRPTGASAGRGRGRDDHAARVRCSAAAGLHPGARRPPPPGGNGSLRPRPHPAATPVGLSTRTHESRGGSVPTLGLVNIGVVATGVLTAPRLEAEAILVEGGRIVAIGAASKIGAAGADVVVDCRGTTVVPGLIDSHCHVVLGDYTPRQKTVDFLGSYVHGGITSVVSAGEGVHAPGRPHDAAASKALAIAAAKCFEHFHPNRMKVDAG